MTNPASYRRKRGQRGVYKLRRMPRLVRHHARQAKEPARAGLVGRTSRYLHAHATRSLLRVGGGVDGSFKQHRGRSQRLQLETAGSRASSASFNVKYCDGGPTRGSRSPWGRASRGADGRARRQEEGHPLLRPQPHAAPRDRRPTCAPSRWRPAPTAFEAARGEWPARACSATVPCVRVHSPWTTTATSSTTSATSCPATPTPSSDGSRATISYALLRGARLREGGAAALTTSGRSRRRSSNRCGAGDGTDADVIALAEDPLEAALQIFYAARRLDPAPVWLGRRSRGGGETPELVAALPAPARRGRGG